MMNENAYTLTLSRLEICDLLLSCSMIAIDAEREAASADCDDYRKNHVLPGTIKKWRSLHDKLSAQLCTNDAKALFEDAFERYRANDITKDELLKRFNEEIVFYIQ